MLRRSILVLSLIPPLALAQDQTVAFASGRIEVVLPAYVRVVSNKENTLVAVFGPAEDHKLELTFHDQLANAAERDVAEQFVRAQAQKKGRRLREAPGKVLFMEPGGDFMIEQKPFKALHLQVGFGKSLVVVTLTAPFSEPMSPALSEFLGKPVNAMVASLRAR
jgi:hypothetical protein